MVGKIWYVGQRGYDFRVHLFVCPSVCLSVSCLIVHTMIPKCTNLVYGMNLCYPRSDMLSGLKGQKSRSQGQ